MSILEKKSARKKKSIMYLVENHEYSPAYALFIVEQLSDEGKLTDADYEELAEYLENLLNEIEKEQEEVVEEPIEEEIEEEYQEL